MTPVLLALLALAGGWREWRPRAGGARPGLWAAAVVAAMGVLVAGQLWSARDRMASYQVRLLGQRFAVSDPNHGDALARVLSGDRSAADLHVGGVGARPVARIRVGEDSNGAPFPEVVRGSERALGVLVVRERDRWRGARWTLLGSVALAPGDEIHAPDAAGALRLTFRRDGGGDRVVVGAPDASARVDVPIPYPDGDSTKLFGRRPSVFQRTYPLADLIAAARASQGADGADVGRGLRSFAYYDRGEARLMALDPGLVVRTPEGFDREPVARLPARRALVAALPLRDHPEPGLAPGERYGVRVQRSMRFDVDSEWLTVHPARPEVHAAGVADLPRDRTAAPGGDGEEIRPLRLSAGDGVGGRADLFLASPADRFAAAAEAVLRLPAKPTAGWFEILAPSGLARWETGRPFTLHDGDRGLLLRVDGLGLSGGFVALLLALFLVAAVPLALPGTSATARTVALAIVALASLRLLLSVSAMVDYPFVDEGHRISLWLIPALPWFLFVAERAGRGRRLDFGPARDRSATSADLAVRETRLAPTSSGDAARAGTDGYMGEVPRARRRRLRAPLGLGRAIRAHLETGVVAGVGAIVATTALVLFPDSRPKAAALAGLAVLTAVLGLAIPEAGRRDRAAGPAGRSARRAAGRPRRLGKRVAERFRSFGCPGLALGAGLFGARVALDLAGLREQLSLGGTRVGLSVLYTPAALLCFALVAALHDRRVAAARGDGGVSDERRSRAALALLDVGAYLALAYAATSFWISDFGIAFTTLPGPLLALAWMGRRWSRWTGPAPALLGAAPLILFVALQAAPDLVRFRPASETDVATRLEDWSRNELLLLERGDPEALQLIGESRSEALGVMRETMRSYTRGNWTGHGFLAGRVSPQIRATSVREHAVTGLLASQWGLAGALALTAVLASVAAAGWPARRAPTNAAATASQATAARPVAVAAGAALVLASLPWPANLLALGTAVAVGLGVALISAWLPAVRAFPARWGDWLWSSARAPTAPPAPVPLPAIVSTTALTTLAGAGVYMILANYGLVLFTGKNVYFLGLDSLSDTAEALALVGLGVWASARADAAGDRAGETDPRAADPGDASPTERRRPRASIPARAAASAHESPPPRRVG